MSVSGFDPSLGSVPNVKLAKVAVAYDCPLTLQTYILIFDQALHMPTLEVNLLCVDQLRDFDVIVNDVPLQRLKVSERNDDSHCLLEGTSGLRIPFEFNRLISYFWCRKPTEVEVLDSINHAHIQLTSSVPWEPYDAESTRIEEGLRRDHQGPEAFHQVCSIVTEREEVNRSFASMSHTTLPVALGDRVEATIFGVKPATLKKTTQRALRDWSKVTGARCFHPTQMQLRYPRLRADVWADVKKGPCVSAEGNRYIAVYAAACQWARGYALKKESDVSDSLKWLFRQIGFPRVIRPDDAQSLTEGEFKLVANKAQVPIHPSEPHHPDQNLAEDCIREATRMYVRIMTASHIPQAFWDRVFIVEISDMSLL